MKTIKINTAELSGVALDWAVAEAVGLVAYTQPDGPVYRPDNGEEWTPSTDWSQGGPLIEKYQIEIKWYGVDGLAMWWNAWHQDIVQFQLGDTILIAACRAIVAAKLGDTVDVPAELVEVKP